MKKSLYFFAAIFCIIAAVSCKKEISSTNHNQNNETSCNLISYHNFTPDTSLHLNFQDTLDYYLDINNDSVPDMYFQLLHYYIFTTQALDAYSIVAVGLDSLELQLNLDSVGSGPCNGALDTLSYVNIQRTFFSSMELLRIEPGHFSCNSFLQKGFVGFRWRHNGSYYCGWIRLQIPGQTILVIDDFAISMCPNDSLKAGQTH